MAGARARADANQYKWAPKHIRRAGPALLAVADGSEGRADKEAHFRVFLIDFSWTFVVHRTILKARHERTGSSVAGLSALLDS